MAEKNKAQKGEMLPDKVNDRMLSVVVAGMTRFVKHRYDHRPYGICGHTAKEPVLEAPWGL